MDGRQPKTYYVYMLASRARTLYIGITSDLQRRLWQHSAKCFEGFSSRYHCNRLIWFERFADPLTAIAREKQLKRWRREKKETLIAISNPTWQDLSQHWGKPSAPFQEPQEHKADPPLRWSLVVRETGSGRDDA